MRRVTLAGGLVQLTFSSDDAAKTLHMQLPVSMPVECGCLMSAAVTP